MTNKKKLITIICITVIGIAAFVIVFIKCNLGRKGGKFGTDAWNYLSTHADVEYSNKHYVVDGKNFDMLCQFFRKVADYKHISTKENQQYDMYIDFNSSAKVRISTEDRVVRIIIGEEFDYSVNISKGKFRKLKKLIGI